MSVSTGTALTLNITSTAGPPKYKNEAVQIDLAPSIPSNTFDIPAGFKNIQP
jgi:hypothetical protein